MSADTTRRATRDRQKAQEAVYRAQRELRRARYALVAAVLVMGAMVPLLVWLVSQT